MRNSIHSDYLREPRTLAPLLLRDAKEEKGSVVSGEYVSPAGHIYPINDGIPDFTTPADLVGGALFARNYYTNISDTYDDNLHVTFDLYNESEGDVRKAMIALLNLRRDSKVLEISAGTGKDSELIVSHLGEDSSLWLLDITPNMLKRAVQRMQRAAVPVNFVVGTACALPFDNNLFDAVYCFAGIGHFPDIGGALTEMARVAKPGGRVVFCEKNVPPWLRDTDYGRILINNNPMFAHEAPLKLIPKQARNVCIRWINGNVHFVVDYTVGVGEPVGNFDLELPGERGGTFNTRYYGQLEGVTEHTKKIAMKARSKLGVSMHKWLDDLVRKAAEKILEDQQDGL